MPDAALASLAILKVNWDTSGIDYTECFVPFVVESVRRSSDDAISLHALQNDLKTQFTIDMPLNALKMVLTRARKRGFLRKEHDVLYRNIEQCSKTRFKERQVKVEATYDAVLQRLQQYAKENHNLDWSASDASEGLNTFLRDNSLALLFSVAEGGVYTSSQDRSSRHFVVGSFIADAQQRNDNQLIEDITALSQGNLLLNVLYLPSPDKLSKKFSNTRVYLDTSFLASAVGFAGPMRAAAPLELIALLKEYDAPLCCFRMSLEETLRILNHCAERLRSQRASDWSGSFLEYFVETRRTASDIELLATRLPQKLRDLSISIDEKPAYEGTVLIDETGFEKAIEDAIHYLNPKARVHDVDCISAVARLRRGRIAYCPEESHALFVTMNSTLAQATRRFFQDESSPGAVTLCMTDYALGNLLWLKNPTITPDLPKKQLLAHAYAAIQPPEPLWKKYLIEAARLQEEGKVSSEDYYLLRYSLASKKILMEVTRGDESAFVEGTVQEVLDIAKERLRADLTQALVIEKGERRRVDNELQKRLEKESSQRITLRSRAAGISKWICRPLHILGVALIMIGTCYAFPWGLPQLSKALLRYVSTAALFGMSVLSFMSLIRGTTLQHFVDTIERALTNKLSEWFLSFAGLTGDKKD
jgi:hypothetical protein